MKEQLTLKKSIRIYQTNNRDKDDDIDSNDVTGYTFIVANLEFNDIDGLRCYLEVDNLKPIDKFRSLFAEPENFLIKEWIFLIVCLEIH
jgi:hypothetical protein